MNWQHKIAAVNIDASNNRENAHVKAIDYSVISNVVYLCFNGQMRQISN